MPSGIDGDDVKAAFGAIQALKDNLAEHCEFAFQKEEEIIIDALTRHGEHLSTLGAPQGHPDPFKLLCWLGSAIMERLEDPDFHQHEMVLESLIKSLEEVLVLETDYKVRLTDNDRNLIKRLVMEELKGNPKHGIGFNGLFTAFHCFRSAYKQIKVGQNGAVEGPSQM